MNDTTYTFKEKAASSAPAAGLECPRCQEHPYWFCSQLSEILRPHPAAYHQVLDWLGKLEAEGRIPGAPPRG